MLSGADLAEADLTCVNLTSAFLNYCNFENAIMKDVQFGVYPNFKCGSEVYCVAMSQKGNMLVCGSENGEV